MSSPHRKRFIAGAECPHCHCEDTIAVWQEERTGVAIAQCMSCGQKMSSPIESVSGALREKEQVIEIFRPK